MPERTPFADGRIDTYWIRRRDADPLHGRLTGCLCDACQNERDYHHLHALPVMRASVEAPPAASREAKYELAEELAAWLGPVLAEVGLVAASDDDRVEELCDLLAAEARFKCISS